MLVKSVSPSLATSQLPCLPQVQLDLDLFPQEQASPADGATFSVAALEQVHCIAGLAPQEQVDFLAQIHSDKEQAILIIQITSRFKNIYPMGGKPFLYLFGA